jgi:hypothetical protein
LNLFANSVRIATETSTLKRAQMTGIMALESIINAAQRFANQNTGNKAKYEQIAEKLMEAKYRIREQYREVGGFDPSNKSKLTALVEKGKLHECENTRDALTQKYFGQYLNSVKQAGTNDQHTKFYIPQNVIQTAIEQHKFAKRLRIHIAIDPDTSAQDQSLQIKKHMVKASPTDVLFLFGHSDAFVDTVKKFLENAPTETKTGLGAQYGKVGGSHRLWNAEMVAVHLEIKKQNGNWAEFPTITEITPVWMPRDRSSESPRKSTLQTGGSAPKPPGF